MSQLNQAQRQAVEHGDGPLLILAGAGSGKTRVITHRIASLIKRGVKPEHIVAVSFTNKAAGEMAERMQPLVGVGKARQIQMSTFHSFGLAMLKEEAKAAGVDGKFVIFDQGDSLGVVKEVLRGMYKSQSTRRLDPMNVLARISNWKSAMVATDAVAESPCDYDTVAREIYPEYEDRLRAMRALDFDDLVCRPVHLLRTDDAVRSKWRSRIRHLLVDEFQDTSEVQLELVKQLANEKRNVCVVGDDDQSIYSWRGANVGNILEFEKHFPGATVVKLETNYRSRKPILEVANAVISNSNSRRHPKVLRSARDGGDAVRRSTCDSPRAESKFVVQEIKDLRETNVPLSEIAVLYRSNQQSRMVEEELAADRIPFQVIGGQQFFDRKEVKDVAAYLRYVVNPWDEISLRRVLNYPTRGIGTRSVQRIEEYAKQHKIPFVRAIFNASGIEGVSDSAAAALRNLKALFDSAREQLKNSGTLHVAARDLVEKINIRSALDDSAEGGKQGEFRFQNVLALLNWIERYEKNAPRDAKSLQDFLRFVTLGGDKNDKDKDGDKDADAKAETVTLCTLHAAKGLEFSVVFLIGCVEGQLPHSRTTDPRAGEASVADLDEERRLFYVGITRARDRLYLVAPERRLLRGKPTEVTPSRYMDDLPSEHIQDYERPPEKNLSFKEIRNLASELLSATGGGDPEATAEAAKFSSARQASVGKIQRAQPSEGKRKAEEKIVTKLPQWRGRPNVVSD